ncbi:toprim domain-containing protein [Hyphomicrobium sp.]|jgi:hypothetical protein|uniref:DUF7146 domain-containing protein n=1 Tax=Hyphomicrobium sp. TaxID=82 RepID=UPI0035672088
MPNTAADVARQLAANAEAFCRYYLSRGKRRGRYWHIGDVHNTPGQSLFVRLYGEESGPGAAGKWTDTATGEFGDLLDVIALQKGHQHLRETLREAFEFLQAPYRPVPLQPRETRSEQAPRRLFRASRPIQGTLGQRYLQSRGVTMSISPAAVRYHPRCYFRDDDKAQLQLWPALIAAVTDLDGRISGVHRTYLALDGSGKAPFNEPRRAMGNLYGNGVRLGKVDDVVVIAEGLETTLSTVALMPRLPAVAALSTSQLFLFRLPPGLKRIYIAADNDAAGDMAATRLEKRASDAGIECLRLCSELKDWNDDLRHLDYSRVRSHILSQLTDEDRQRFAA